MDKSGRIKRVSLQQLEILWQFLMANRDVAVAYNRSLEAKDFSKRKWKELAQILNSQHMGTYKDWKGWSKYWVDYKAKLKARVAAARSSLGLDNPLTEWEVKFLQILGDDFGEKPAKQVEPFPKLEATTDSVVTDMQDTTTSESTVQNIHSVPDIPTILSLRADPLTLPETSCINQSSNGSPTQPIEPPEGALPHTSQRWRQSRESQMSSEAAKRAIVRSSRICARAAVQTTKAMEKMVQHLAHLRTDFSEIVRAAERDSHPSARQIQSLLQYLETHPELARGYPKTPAAKLRVRRHWQQLAPRLNAIGNSVKTWRQWNKYWADKKLEVKRKAAIRDSVRRGDRDHDQFVELNDVERQILALATGDRPGGGNSPLRFENSYSENEVTSETSGADGLTMDGSEHVMLRVPQEDLIQEDTPPLDPPASPSPSPSPAPSPTPSLRQESCRRTPQSRSPPPAPPSRYAGTKRRRLSQPESRSHLSTLTERLLSLEEQRLTLEKRNTSVQETLAALATQLMDRDYERERVFAQALQTVGDGLRLLAETLRREDPIM